MSESYGGLVTFVLTGFLLASIVIFSVVAVPEMVPFFSPALKTGDITIDATCSSVQGSEDYRIYVVLTGVEFHRTGVSGGSWVSAMSESRQVELIDASQSPQFLTESRLPIGEYNLARVTISNVSLSRAGSNIALKVPSNIPVVPVDFDVTEKVPVTLELDIAFDPGTITVLWRFDPYLSMVIKQAPAYKLSMDQLSVIASFGPKTQQPGGEWTFKFEIASGHEVDNYLLYAKGGSNGNNTFDVEMKQTGELWGDISGEAWFVGGNLTAGSYDVAVRVSGEASQPVTFLINIFGVPRIPTGLPQPAFEGLVHSPEFAPAPINEVGLYVETAGSYNIYMAVGSGDFEFLMDNSPISVVTSNRTITLDLSEGFHSFQILPDYSGSGRDTSWLLVFTWISAPTSPSLSPGAVFATMLLIASAFLWILNFMLTRVVERRVERTSSTETEIEKPANYVRRSRSTSRPG
jgi:hypothetical protein